MKTSEIAEGETCLARIIQAANVGPLSPEKTTPTSAPIEEVPTARPVFDRLNLWSAVWPMAISQVICECGAIYQRTDREIRTTDGFSCAVCGHSLERFAQVKAPSYRLIVGPIRMPTTRS